MRLILADFDKKFDESKVVTNENDIDNNTKAFLDDGIFSEKIFGSLHSLNKDLDNGWIDFGDNYIINPLFFNYMKRLFPTGKLVRILKTEKQIDKDGNEIQDELDDIGLLKFRENFKYYCEKYANKGYKDTEEWKFIQRHRKILFINKFPIIHPKFRPCVVIGNYATGYDLNKYYKLAIKYANELKSLDIELEGDMEVGQLLFNLQEYLNKIIIEINNSLLRKKKGLFRNNCLGTRINYSARNIITPLVGYRIDEIAIPYKTYLELYSKLLINLISKTEGITKNEAKRKVRKAKRYFDPKMYKYMNELLHKTKGGQYCLVIRNPTIKLGSVIRCKIAVIKSDYNDLTLSVSNNLLQAWAGDYDGDVDNIIPLFNRHLVEVFSLFAPEELIIDCNDGSFNTEFFMDKEQRLAIHMLNNKNENKKLKKLFVA